MRARLSAFVALVAAATLVTWKLPGGGLMPLFWVGVIVGVAVVAVVAVLAAVEARPGEEPSDVRAEDAAAAEVEAEPEPVEVTQ